MQRLLALRSNDDGQGITEYVMLLAFVLVLVVGTVRLVGGNADRALSSVASILRHSKPDD